MPDGVSIPGGPSFIGNPQPPDVPCDPTGDAWRGPPGPVGPQGPPAAAGNLTGPINIVNLPNAQPDGSPPIGAIPGDMYINGGFLCIAR